MKTYSSLQWQNGVLRLLDQRLLPGRQVYVDITGVDQAAAAIRDMVVRGAPLIGVTAAFGMLLPLLHTEINSLETARLRLEEAAETLKASRPTAVNLSWAVQRMLQAAGDPYVKSVPELTKRLLHEASSIQDEDIRTNRQIAQHALPLVPMGAVFIHHCNTGGLATVDYGTALGIIRLAHESGRNIFVLVDETRPRLQGARLTAWELAQLGIPHRVIVDGASGFVMQHYKVDLVTVGCDRVARNGDVANKIGTYNLALVAKAHGVPFYVAAPTSTIDLSTASGRDIPIEERDAAEVRQVGPEVILPDESPVFNPAFDVTPAGLITAIITEGGVAYPPFEESLPQMVKNAGQIHRPGTPS